MAMKPRALGQLELAVLKAVWERPGSTVQELADIMSTRRPCARTTILTVVQRLHAKGFLKRRKVKGVFRFTPTRERRTVLSRLVSQFVDTVLDGSPAPFLTYLADTRRLTERQLSELREILGQMGDKEKEG